VLSRAQSAASAAWSVPPWEMDLVEDLDDDSLFVTRK
jgi:hypothetical protein